MNQQDDAEENGPAPDRGPTGRTETERAATTVAGTNKGGDTRCS
jgi:hypothetical protein